MTVRSFSGPALVLTLAVAALVAAIVAIGIRGTPGEGTGAASASPPAIGSSGLSAPATPTGSTAAAGPSASAGHPVASAALPAFDHIFVVVMENESASAIIGNPNAPYINQLARTYGLASDYTAVAHPSEPNYLALWGGSTQGVTDDGVYDFGSGTTLADQVESSGRTWHVAAENVPTSCYMGARASGGEDGPGTYARRHEPAISWTSISGDPTRCASITDFTHFDPNAGNFWLVVPNLCHDMHDCSIATGDAFLKGWLPTIMTSPAFGTGVVFLTWDEGSTATGGGGKVAALVISPLARPGFTSAAPYSHYSLLRTIEDAWGLGCLANSCSTNDLREFFTSGR